MISIAVDIGGTFTDVVAVDSESGDYYAIKVPSTPARLVQAVADGAAQVLAHAGAEPASVGRFIHGTTVATNAVLEEKGSVTGLLATAGFEDVLEMGRQHRSRIYDLNIDSETPVMLAPKRRRRGVPERVAPDGTIITPLDEEAARATIVDLVENQGVQAFAVCLLFSFRNPSHELRLREIIREVDPALGVSLSCEVDPMFREYERTVVTAFDAYVRPVVERYVGELAAELASIGIDCRLQIMQSRGGITSAEMISRRPVTSLLSGPAAGVIGGRHAAERSGLSSLITIDIGGTSADISLVSAGKPLIFTEGKIGRYPLRVPMVDVNTIGAGGGSIAWIDAGGSFHVGPQSAGSSPGPVCYGRGGTEPTVTDASIVLGYLDPGYFAGGTMELDAAAAHEALDAFGARLGLSGVEAAAGIHRVINSKMADEIRLVSIKRGYDPREFALVALGGAGSVHGGRLAAELGIPKLVVPPVPGVLSALGLLVASVEHDSVGTVAIPTDQATPDSLTEVFARLERQVEELMSADRVPAGAATISRFADMRYVGQGYTLEVTVPGTLDSTAIGAVETAFHETHERVYGYSHPDAETEIVNVVVVGEWALEQPRFENAPASAAGREPSVRQAYFAELGGFVEVPIRPRDSLAVGESLEGPAIVEQADTTLVVYPGQKLEVDEASNLIISVAAPIAMADTVAVGS